MSAPDLTAVHIYVALCVVVVGLLLAADARAFAVPTYSVTPCARAVATYGHRAKSTKHALRACQGAAVAARAHGLDPRLGVALARVESDFRALAVGGAGEVGAVQVMPRYHCPRVVGVHLCLPYQAISVGMRHLARLKRRHGLAGGLARYRTGARNYARSSSWRETGDEYAGQVAAVRGRL